MPPKLSLRAHDQNLTQIITYRMSNQENMQKPLLEIKGLTKSFPSVLANNHISLDVKKGEIHCLLGENGAGKSTLSKCLYGYYQPDSGEIFYKEKKIHLFSPSDAIKLHIGMVHQHFMLIRPFTVLENIALGLQSSDLILDYKQIEENVKSLCAEYGVELNLETEIWQLPVGQQQWVEILKALYFGTELLILDEPTAVLTPQEVDKLFDVLKQMKSRGLSIIFITHKLKEVMKVSDRVSVLRKGRLINTVNTSEVTKEDLALMMVGREIVLRVKKRDISAGDTLLELKNLHVRDERGKLALNDISLKIHKNEILGIAGVSGNGQKELFEVLIGIREIEKGQILFNGEDISRTSPSQRASLGFSHIPADRITEGLILDFSVKENLILGQQRKPPYRRGLFLNQQVINHKAKEFIDAYSIDTPSIEQQVSLLSGGNMQKVILARELNKNPKCLIANQPTRGLDVGVVEYVQEELLLKRDAGLGILLISEDLDEIFSLSSRIAVMFKGHIVGILDAKKTNLEEIGLLMTGMSD